MTSEVRSDIRRVIGEHGRLPVDAASLADDADLWGAGMSSHATVDVMLAIEEAFDVEFPDRLLRRSTFASIDALADAVGEMRNGDGGDGQR